MPTLYLLAGPTASGKTEFSLRFAQQNNCEIISCDASSFYREMDIGTAKPTQDERKYVKHWGIDIVDPNDSFSIKDFVTLSNEWVNDVVNRGKNVLVVGGSGFYLKSFLEPVVDNVPVPDATIEYVERLDKKGGSEEVLQELVKYNTEFPDNFDIKNPRKVKKALIRCLMTGKSLSDLWNEFTEQTKPFPYLKKEVYWIVCPLEVLKQRIVLRVRKMLREGLLEEVKTLLDKNVLVPGTPAGMAIGYRESVDYLKNSSSLELLSDQIIQNTYALAKKQNTWFRHQMKFDRYLFV